jgi:serine protease inhibitor
MSACGPGTRVVSPSAYQLNGNDGTVTTEGDAMGADMGADTTDDTVDNDAADLCPTPPADAHPPNAAIEITAPSQRRATVTPLRRSACKNGCTLGQKRTGRNPRSTEPTPAPRRPTAVKRSWSRASRAGLAIVVAATLAACASSSTKAVSVTSPTNVTTPTELRATGVARADPGSLSTAPLVEGINTFGHDLYAQAATGGNVVVSPLSIEVAMSMARAGAGGTTAAEIDAAMHFPSTGRDTQMNALTRDLATQDTAPPVSSPAASRDPNAPPAAPILTIANGMFVQQGQPIGQAFLQTMATDYGSGVRTVDFRSPSATAQINAWVRTQTANRIQQLFDAIDPDTRLVLANAVYLKADWATPFAQQPTSDATFTTAAGKQITVPTMHQDGTLGYTSSDSWQAVALPYAGGTLTMYVIVPTADTSLADLLAPATLAQISNGLRPTSMSLALPRWTSTTKLNLEPVLTTLGIHAAFTTAADFAGIAPELLIGQAIHRATITVDEWGTEAAAVTGLAFAASSEMAPPLTVRADHPFAYAIVNAQTGVVVFEGSVADPTAG